MSDLFDDGGPEGRNEPEFTVSEISGAVKRTIEGAFSHVRIRGEVGRVMHARSGHFYFDLKDDRSVIAAVAWKGVANRLRTLPEEGMEVIAKGKISTFGGQSKYQLIVEDVAPAGVGALMAMLEKRRKAFAAEGLFDEGRKKPIPYLPKVIGVVTSPGGAVIRDILHRLRDRFPRPVLLWPVVVQGDKCAAEVSASIRGFDALDGSTLPRPDVLIIARGGGSIEDLWGFNEEVVVRAVADCQIPVISAVGHETDTTLVDFVADRRAPTPTAAAEMAVPVRMELLATVASFEDRRLRAMSKALEARRVRLSDVSRLLPKPQTILAERAQGLDGLSDRLPRALRGLAQARRAQLLQAAGRFGPALLAGFLRERRGGLDREAARLAPALTRRAREAGQRLGTLGERLSPRRIGEAVTLGRERLTQQGNRAEAAERARLARLKDQLAALERMRATLGYTETLSRGYAVVRDGDQVISTAKAAKVATRLEIEFADGRVLTGAEPGEEPSRLPGKGPKKAAKPAKPAPKPTDQGSLF